MIRYRSQTSPIIGPTVIEEPEDQKTGVWVDSDIKEKNKNLLKFIEKNIKREQIDNLVNFSVTKKSTIINGVADFSPKDGVLVTIQDNIHFIYLSQGKDNFY